MHGKDLLFSDIYLSLLQTKQSQPAQTIMKEFVTLSTVDTKPKPKKRKKNQVTVENQTSAKCLVVTGDTLFVRDYLMSMQHSCGFQLQQITGSARRNAKSFLTIFESSQCRSALPQSSRHKLLYFSDVDVVFADEQDFYSQLVKLIQVTRVPVIVSAASHTYVAQHLFPVLHRNHISF